MFGGVFRKIANGKHCEKLLNSPFLYERIILTTTTTGTIMGCIIGATEPGYKTLSYRVSNSIISGLIGGCIGVCVCVLSPVIIPISVVGGVIGGSVHGFSVIKQKNST